MTGDWVVAVVLAWLLAAVALVVVLHRARRARDDWDQR